MIRLEAQGIGDLHQFDAGVTPILVPLEGKLFPPTSVARGKDHLDEENFGLLNHTHLPRAALWCLTEISRVCSFRNSCICWGEHTSEHPWKQGHPGLGCASQAQEQSCTHTGAHL